MSDVTYPEVGATRDSRELPAGYRQARRTAPIGSGVSAFHRAAHGVMTWQMHRRCGMRVNATSYRAAPGVEVTTSLGLGPLRLSMPCKVVWTVEEPRRVGFGYGTLPGHPATGEEAFVVEIDDEGAVRFTVTAFSRPATWYAKLGGPLTVLAQDLAGRQYVSATRRLTDEAVGPPL